MPESEVERHSRWLRWAELQFLLAYKVRSETVEHLRLDQPLAWTYGSHLMTQDELTLTYDEATLASAVLQHSATLSLTIQIRSVFKQIIKNARSSDDFNKVSAFEISRLIRNAYTHNPADPHWSIDLSCRDKLYCVEGIIALDTSGLQNKRFRWTDYGGPIALYRLSEFVRTHLLPEYEK